MQREAKKAGRPWARAKGFDHSAPCGDLRATGGSELPATGAIRLSVNGELRQDSDLRAMTWSAAEVLAHLSAEIRLLPGDLVYTGTPAGVGPLEVGDEVRAEIDGVGALALRIV